MIRKNNFFPFTLESGMVSYLYKRIETYFEKQNYKLRDAVIGNTKELKPNLKVTKL